MNCPGIRSRTGVTVSDAEPDTFGLSSKSNDGTGTGTKAARLNPPADRDRAVGAESLNHWYNGLMLDDPFPLDVYTARKMQDTLRKQVRLIPLQTGPTLVAGVDASFNNHEVIAVASLFSYPEMEHIRDAWQREPLVFPYLPGLLSFREGKAMTGAIRRLSKSPDIVLVDGQGIAHPKGIGIASHIGVVLRIPTIGCAKSRLIGEYEEPKPEKGSWSDLFYHGRRVGVVLRTRDDVRPLFVSPGHLIDFRSAVRIVMACLTAYRIPEPLRRADAISKALRSQPRKS